VRSLPGLPPAFVTTFIRGDRLRKTTRVYVALWDSRQVELHTMAGVAEPKSATGETGPGMVPREPAVMRRLAAACNAGFQSLHGEFGMMSDGVIYLPPKPYGATVAVKRDGAIAFGTWPNDPSVPSDILSFRQNLTPLVVDGKFNPYGRTWWGGTPSDWEDKTHTVRTGICLTKEGFVGYFYGAELSPEALAQAMVQTRCVYGIALDMNAGHSGLEFYTAAPAAELPPLERPLRQEWEREGEVPGLDGWKFRARRLIVGMGLMYFPRYIKREGRDYFYMTLRPLLPGRALELGGTSTPWQVKGLPQHGFPYALATAESSLSSGSKVRLLKVDPRMVRAVEASQGCGAAAAPPATPAEPSVGTVLLLAQPEQAVAPTGPAVWATADAFSVGREPPTAEALRLAAGGSAADVPLARAAIGVQQEDGMLVYAELGAPDGAPAGSLPQPVAAAELQSLLAPLDVPAPVLLAEPLALALGGESSLARQPVRLGCGAGTVELRRKAGPGASRIFPDTAVVPLKEWYPLQSRRIRYFKKKEADK